MAIPDYKDNTLPNPQITDNTVSIPQKTNVEIPKPKETKGKKRLPKEPKNEIPNPQETPIDIPNPQYTPKEIPKPNVGHPQNLVFFGNEWFEIKPTKNKYQRDKTFMTYRILREIPVADFLSYEDGFFDENRSSDKMLFDWLIAATNDPELVKRNYDDIDAATIDEILKITCRLNGIDDREERKNQKAQMTNP